MNGTVKKRRLDDVIAVITVGGFILCMKCADDKDLSAVVSEDDLILRGTITAGDRIICDRCAKPIIDC